MASRTSMLASSRVAPLSASLVLSSVSPDQTIRDAVLSKSSIVFLPRPEEKRLRHYSSQLRPHLQWGPAAKIQLLVVRNALACLATAVSVNGCYYMGNIFSFKPSTKQSRPEFLMAMLLWTAVMHIVIMTIAHLPVLTTQRFLRFPDSKPSRLFCIRKLTISSSPYFAATLAGMVGLGILVQNTSLMYENFKYKLHFYLSVLCNFICTAGVSFAVRTIYYEETCNGRDRRSAMNQMSARKLTMNTQYRPRHRPPARKGHRPLNYRASGFWKEFVAKFPSPLIVALAGGFVHIVAWYRILDRGTVIIMGFTALGIVIKLGLQEAARHYIIKKRIRSIHTMCILVGVPTVLIDTQARIVMLGSQTNTFLVLGTFAMAIAEICLRVGKATYVVWEIRRREAVLELNLSQFSTQSASSGCRESSLLSLKMEFDLWRRQVLSYHTAEVTADMYAEYIAIGCSQSLIFWFVGHPFYPALHLGTGRGSSEVDISRWRFNQVAMLGFQFVVEIFVDYVCVVLEMAAGINFDRIESLSTFLGVLFMTMAAININISTAVYLS